MVAPRRSRIHLHKIPKRSVQPRPHAEHQRPDCRYGQLLQSRHLSRLATLGSGDGQSALPFAHIQYQRTIKNLQQPLRSMASGRRRLAYLSPRLPRSRHLSGRLGHLRHTLQQQAPKLQFPRRNILSLQQGLETHCCIRYGLR